MNETQELRLAALRCAVASATGTDYDGWWYLARARSFEQYLRDGTTPYHPDAEQAVNGQ